ncbi:MAG: DUF86 domain-containing protein [Anaerolineae bacterium]|nr:DUF86 domain-containing protein [Anaerolineae bacterium]
MASDDQLRLQHMIDSAEEVIAFSKQRRREDLDADMLLVRGLSMSIGILGEAAAHVSDHTRLLVPEIPWRDIVAMRNFLMHEYFRVDMDLLWLTATQSVPEILPLLIRLVDRST